MSNFSSQVPQGTYGIFTFNGSLTGYGPADLLLGLPFSSQRLDPLINRTQLDSELGIFAQDSVKVSNQLTLEIGLRWDRFGASTYQDGLVYNWDPASGNVVVPQQGLKSISPLYPTNSINVVTGKAVENPSLHNFVPRLGVAYRPFGANFVVRAGYGIYTATTGNTPGLPLRVSALTSSARLSSTRFRADSRCSHSPIRFQPAPEVLHRRVSRGSPLTRRTAASISSTSLWSVSFTTSGYGSLIRGPAPTG